MQDAAAWGIQLAVLVGAAVVTTVVAELVRRHRRGWLARVRGERVLVHTIHDQTLEGSLVEVLRDGLVLKAPRMIDDAPVAIAGDVFVPREKVALVQRLGGARVQRAGGDGS